MIESYDNHNQESNQNSSCLSNSMKLISSKIIFLRVVLRDKIRADLEELLQAVENWQIPVVRNQIRILLYIAAMCLVFHSNNAFLIQPTDEGRNVK